MVQANTKIHLTECVCAWQSWRFPAFKHCNGWDTSVHIRCAAESQMMRLCYIRGLYGSARCTLLHGLISLHRWRCHGCLASHTTLPAYPLCQSSRHLPAQEGFSRRNAADALPQFVRF